MTTIATTDLKAREGSFPPPLFQRDASGKPVLPLEAGRIYQFGHLIRGLETMLLKLFSQGLLSGTTHTCIGQELCQMSVVRALHDEGDAVLSNHRNHGHFLTYSGEFLGLMAEIMGREAGVCGGIGGSQHLALRHFHSNGVQAGMTAIGIGLALARKMRGEESLVATIVGDGTLGQGLLYESMNLAAIWNLRVLFVLENNGIAQTTPTAETVAGRIADRGAAFGLDTWHLRDDGPEFLTDVEDVVAAVRSRRHPGLLVIDTKRMGPHSKGDDLRDDAEMGLIRRRDPLARLGDTLDAAQRWAIESANDAFLDGARQAAELSPESSRLVAEHTSLRPARPPRLICTPPSSGNMRAHLNAALRQMLAECPEVLLLGEDLHDPYGGAFKVTAGLNSLYPERVISTPISEAGVMGTGIGLAMDGFLPVVEIMFADFVTLGMDQLYNHAVKFPGMFPGIEVPLVVRTPSGGRRGYGPTHSQSPENLLFGVPGLTIVYPSHRHAVGSVLQNAVLRWPNPTVFFEHKLLYGEMVDRLQYETVPSVSPGTDLFPTLRWSAEAPDLTLVTYGGMLPQVESLAAELREEELSIEIIVPSLLSPLPKNEIIGLLASRSRVAVIEEGYAEGGFGPAVGTALLEAGFSGRFRRLSTSPVPIPAARSLEARVIPGRPALMALMLELLAE